MVDIFAHVIQVVVFAPCTNTLLGVSSALQPGHGVGRIDGIEENGLKLNGMHKKQIHEVCSESKCCESVGTSKRASLEERSPDIS